MFRRKITLRSLFALVTLACLVFAAWNYYNRRVRPSIVLDERRMAIDIDRISCVCLTILAENLDGNFVIEMKSLGKPWREIGKVRCGGRYSSHCEEDIWIHEAEGADSATVDVLCQGRNVFTTVIDKTTPIASHIQSRPLDLAAARKSSIFWHKEWFNETGNVMTLDFRVVY